MINLIEKINEKYQNKYNYLKLYNVMYDKNLKECTITFLYPYLIDEISVENKNKIIIEANRQYSTNLFEKNASYVFKNSYMESNIGQNEYQSIFIVNVDNFNHYHTKRPILTFKPTDEEGHIEHGLYTSFHLVLENFDNPQYTISE